MATTTPLLKTEPTRDEAKQWRTRPALSLAVRLLSVLIPIAASVAATRLGAQIVPRPRSVGRAIAWWAVMLLLATVVVFTVQRVTRRLAPLAALLKLSLVFPDRAPSRFSVALRSGTVRQLQGRYETVKRDGLGSTPAEAARKVVELIGALNAHDHMTRGHCERVRAYTALIAEELKLPADDVDKLRWAALLHDLGKLEVPSGILNKKGKLDDREWAIVKAHPAAGGRMAAPLAGWLGEAFLAIAEHHERWDGAGYPAGLAGFDISLGGRIVSVADAFDVMTAARSYKRPSSPSAARAELVRCAGTQFDPVVVRAFLNVSLGRLRLMIGPLSWLAQLPMLAQGPISAATGTVATTAIAATVAVGGSTLVGMLPVAAEAVPAEAHANGPLAPLTVIDPVTGATIALTTTTTATTITTADRSTPTTAAPVVDSATTTTAVAVPVDGAPITVPGAGTTTTTTPSTVTSPTTAPPKATSPTTAPPVTAAPITVPPITVPPITAVVTTIVAVIPTTTTTTTTVPVTAPTTTTTVSGNRAPFAVNDSGVVRAGLLGLSLGPVNVRVLDNDSDPDGDSINIVSFTQPASGTVTKHGDELRYDSGLIAVGATFTYTISDGRGHLATATVTITVG
jgi:HD-GYP domain-containing protein (c-di-GMP phosphodiesterase class II)